MKSPGQPVIDCCQTVVVARPSGLGCVLLLTQWRLVDRRSAAENCSPVGLRQCWKLRSSRQSHNQICMCNAGQIIFWRSELTIINNTTAAEFWLIQGFRDKLRFQQVSGAISGIHIKITPSPNNSSCYYSGKGDYFIILQEKDFGTLMLSEQASFMMPQFCPSCHCMNLTMQAIFYLTGLKPLRGLMCFIFCWVIWPILCWLG